MHHRRQKRRAAKLRRDLARFGLATEDLGEASRRVCAAFVDLVRTSAKTAQAVSRRFRVDRSRLKFLHADTIGGPFEEWRGGPQKSVVIPVVTETGSTDDVVIKAQIVDA